MKNSLALLPLFFAILACSEPDEVQLSDEDFTRMAEGLPVPAPENPNAKAFEKTLKDELIDFTFAYPAEAAAIARLKADFDEKFEKSLAELREMALKEAEFRKEEGMDFGGLYSKSIYTRQGNSRRFLSLLGETETYTGGAHGNRGTVSIFWDRIMEKPVDPAVLFGNADQRDDALRSEFCEQLEVARRSRIGEVPDDSMFGDCPDLDAVTIVPVDGNDDGAFDTFRLIADPYVAGAYAEGDYRIDLPVTRARQAEIAEPYRADFGQ